MHKHNYFSLWIALILLSLTSCLVDKDSVPEVFRIDATKLNLHHYQTGDWIDYMVSGFDSNTNLPIRGQLSVSWSSNNTPINKPLGEPGIFDVLEETALLEIDPGPIEFNNAVVRYISQESTDPAKLGTYYVHAYNDAGIDNYFWLSNEDVLNLFSDVAIIENLASPLPPTGDLPKKFTPGPYHAFRGCDSVSPCDSLAVAQLVRQFYTFEGIDTIDTNLGRFEAYRIDFTDTGTNTDTANLLLDIRHFCVAQDSGGDFAISSIGKFWVHPEVGIIKYDFFCTNTGTTKFIASISATNIKLPAKN